jgi:hypothetical protein
LRTRFIAAICDAMEGLGPGWLPTILREVEERRKEVLAK